MNKIKTLAAIAVLLAVYSLPVYAECQGGTVPVGGRCLISEPAPTEPEKDAEDAEDVFDRIVKWLRSVKIIN